MAHKHDYYGVLGVARDASTLEIRSAHRRLARHHHPDQNPGSDSPERFRALAEAYGVLNDPARRARYDHASRPARPDAPHERPAVRTVRGVLELSAREAPLAAMTRLTLTTVHGVVIVLPAGVRDKDEVTLTAGIDTVLLTVRVNPGLKT